MTGTERDIDPVTLEVLWSRLRGIPDEMGTHLRRTAFSEVIKYGDDFSTGLFTWDGRLVAQGVYTPGHLGAMPFAMREVLEEHFGPDAWEPGDVVLTNDPFLGSGHLPDFFTFEPIFYEGDPVGFAVTTGNQIDIGGGAPGSFTMYAPDIYAEGIQIPPVKLYEGGELNEPLMETILQNSRVPEKMRGDVRAQRGASKVGADLFREVVDEFGLGTVRRYVEEIFDRTERTMKGSIGEVPDGTYGFTDRLDGWEEPLPIRATVTVDGEELAVDFEGSAPQQEAYAINSGWNYTFSYTMQSIKSTIDPETPPTHGTYQAIEMTAPEGSIVNPTRPVPVGSRHLMANVIVSTVNGALFQAVPEDVPACGAQGCTQGMKFTDAETGEQQVLLDLFYGGGGARSTRDGYPSVSGATNVKNLPVETVEAEYPLRIHRYGLVPDTAGAGEHRGGNGTVREYEFRRTAHVQCINERFDRGPYGLAGGERGRPGRLVRNPDADATELDGKAELDLDRGDVLQVFSPGGGGYGDPADRDPERVREDYENGLVTAREASEVFGVDVTK
jgi:N-methylhydantoinase B